MPHVCSAHQKHAIISLPRNIEAHTQNMYMSSGYQNVLNSLWRKQAGNRAIQIHLVGRFTGSTPKISRRSQRIPAVSCQTRLCSTQNLAEMRKTKYILPRRKVEKPEGSKQKNSSNGTRVRMQSLAPNLTIPSVKYQGAKGRFGSLLPLRLTC